MNDKELREIRRRFRSNKNNIMSIKGCIVDHEKNIKSYINQSMINTLSDDSEKLLSLMKKSLSGSVGINLFDLEYQSMQVMDSEEHKLLMELRNSKLVNEDALNIFFNKVIESVNFEGSFAILLACDDYDVFSYNESGEREEESNSVFTYIVCSICSIKDAKPSLYYSDFDNTFRTTDKFSLLGNPEIGFMFPTFDDRATNIYKAQFYSKDVSNTYPDFIKNIFNVLSPMASTIQKDSFGLCLNETLSDDCSFNVIRSVHEHVSELVQEHKISKQEEPLRLSKNSFRTVLESCGVSDEKVENFESKFDESFGKNAEIVPSAIIDVKKFEVSTPYVSIKVDPERSDLISTQIINGSRYILIRANDSVEVNGVNIDFHAD
ncbi:MAG: DUF4317 domain-containing protein [Clostridia bacterium]|nr:DUF4317 domain-containing protein [Clostridia bacterium]